MLLQTVFPIPYQLTRQGQVLMELASTYSHCSVWYVVRTRRGS